MKNLDLVVRVLLGLVFILFGFSKFYAFMPTPPMTSSAANFFGAIIATGYLYELVGILEIMGGILILFNRSSVLGLMILSPIIINIIAYLIFLQHSIGAPPILMVLFLLTSSLFLAYRRWDRWKSVIFEQ